MSWIDGWGVGFVCIKINWFTSNYRDEWCCYNCITALCNWIEIMGMPKKCLFSTIRHILEKLGLTNKHYKALWPICESWKDEAKNPFSDSRTVSGNPGVQETLNCTKLAHGLGRKWDLPQIKWKFDMHFNWTSTHLLVLPPSFCLCIIASLPGIKYDNLINPQARLRYPL